MKKRANGEGTIFFRESRKCWMAQCSVGYKSDGSIKRKTITGKTRKEVAEKLNAISNKIITNTYIQENNVTLMEMINSLIDEGYKANTLSPASYKRIQDTSKIIERDIIADMPLQDITNQDFIRFLGTITNYSNSVISKIYGLLTRTCDKAVLLKVINTNPFRITGAIIKPRSLKSDKKISAFTIDEQKALVKELNSKDDMYYDIMLIGLNTGMRMGEVLGLIASDIDFDKKRLNIQRTITKDKDDKTILGSKTKTYAGTRVIPLNDTTLNILAKYKNSKDLLFTYLGKPIPTSVVSSHLRIACKRAGIRLSVTKVMNRNKLVNLNTSDVSSHMLRHTYATRCIEAGVTAVVVQRLLGHKDITTTLNTYTDVFHELKEDEMNKMQAYMETII